MQQAFVLYQAVRSKEDGPYDDLLRVEMNSVALKASAHAPGTTVRQTFPNADPKWVAALLSVALTGKGGRWEQPGATRDTWYELDAYSPEPGHCAVLMTDITERRQHNEARELLAREVEHRSKNLFAVVLSLLQLTKGKSVDEDLIGRMTTLARIHSTLKLRDGASTDLKSVIGMELEPFITEGSLSQVSFDGPDIDLNAVEAQAIGMAVHELTTNAAKYGALSRPDGRLRVMWAREGGGTISLSWRESGGPPTPNSEKPGFGGRLLQGLIQGQLHGSIRPLWDTTGLTIDIRFEVSDTGVSEAPRAVA